MSAVQAALLAEFESFSLPRASLTYSGFIRLQTRLLRKWAATAGSRQGQSSDLHVFAAQGTSSLIITERFSHACVQIGAPSA